jgi:hypothetical protein
MVNSLKEDFTLYKAGTVPIYGESKPPRRRGAEEEGEGLKK